LDLIVDSKKEKEEERGGKLYKLFKERKRSKTFRVQTCISDTAF
jgi:hypothetical protein